MFSANDNTSDDPNRENTWGGLPLARVLGGAKAFKDNGIKNLGDTYSGQIKFGNNVIKNAIIKDIPHRELVNEIIVAGLAEKLGLPVPQRAVAIAPRGSIFKKKIELHDGQALLFASVMVDARSIGSIYSTTLCAHKMGKFRKIINLLIKTSWVGDLYGFDAWVANVDRHMSNILFGNKFWLIDHGRCFGSDNWNVSNLVPDAEFTSRLSEWVTPHIDEKTQKGLAAKASKFASQLRALDLEAISSASNYGDLLETSEVSALIKFLQDRVISVPTEANKALNQPGLI